MVVSAFCSAESCATVRSFSATIRAFAAEPGLESLRGVVDDSGEGRWMVQEAVDRAVPMNVIAAALFARFASREDDAFSLRVLAALRREFGGHAVHHIAAPTTAGCQHNGNTAAPFFVTDGDTVDQYVRHFCCNRKWE